MSLHNADPGPLNSENTGVGWHKSETFIFEDVSSVATAQVDNDSLKMPTYLDMPLLDGVSLDFAYDESNINNTYVPFHVNNESIDHKTALNVENETDINVFVFDGPVDTRNTYDHQSICNYIQPKYMDTELACLPINYKSCHSEESAVNFCNPVTIDNEVISEFLVFHDKPSENYDPQLCQLLESQSDPQLEPQTNLQLTLNCFVKLNPIEVTSALKKGLVTLEKKVRFSKRRTTRVENYFPKETKCNQPRRKKSGNAVKHWACPPKRPNTRNSKSSRVDATTSNSEGPQIRMKFVRQNNSKNFECVLLSDISGSDVHKTQLKNKSCSVVLERLPTSNMCQPVSNKAKSPKADYNKAETPKAAYSRVASSKTVPLKASSKSSTSQAVPSKADTVIVRSAKAWSSEAVSTKAWSPEAMEDIALSSESDSDIESSKGELVTDITTSTNPGIGQESKTIVTSVNCSTDKDNEIAAITPSLVLQNYIENLPLDLTVAKGETALDLVIKEKQTALLDDVNQSNEISNSLTPVDYVFQKETLTTADEKLLCQVINNGVKERNHLLNSEVVARNKVQLDTSIDETSIFDSNDKMLNVTCMDNAPYGTATNERSNFGNSPRSSDDDNCSISSELSIFAPSLSDIFDSPKRGMMIETDKPVRNENGETKTKNYRIPKLKKTLENTIEIKQSEFKGLDASDELNVTHILKQMKATLPRMLSPIKDLDFSISEDSETNNNIQKKTVSKPKNIRSLRSSVKKKTVYNDEINKNSKSNIDNSYDKKRNTRCNTIERTIDNRSRQKIYEDSRGFSDAIDAANSSTKNNKRKIRSRSNTTEGPTKKKALESKSNINVSKSEKRKSGSSNTAEKKRINVVDKIVEPEMNSSVDAATYNTNKKHTAGSSSTEDPTAKIIINSIEKTLDPYRQRNDAPGVSVSRERPENIFRKETNQSLNLRPEVQSITNANKLEKIVIRVNEKVRNVSIAAENNVLTRVSPQTAPLFPHPTQSFSNQPNQLLPNQPLPIQKPNQGLLNQPLPITSQHIMPIFTPIQKSPESLNQEVLEQTIQNLNGSFTSKGCMNFETRKRYLSQVLAIFNQPCINYLVKNPCPTPCSSCHVLPHADIIYKILQTFSDDLVQFIYSDFIVKYCLTFEQYFPLICQLYGSRKLDMKLSSLVVDCEKYGKYEYFGFIFNGLLLCGMNNRDALLIIVDRCNNICSASDEAILKIIESDPQSFIQIFSRAPRLTSLLSPELMSKLMIQLSNNPTNPSQLSQCVDLLEKIGEKLVNIDQEVLRLFCIPIFGIRDDNLSTKILRMVSAVMTNN